MHQGSCLCEQVQFEVNGDFNGFFFCHCSRCRKGTGSAHGANLFSMTARLNWIKGQDLIKTFHLPNTRFQKTFCTNCGAALPSLHESGRLLVPAGCLDTEVVTQPSAHIFVASRANWDNDLDKVPRFDQRPL